MFVRNLSVVAPMILAFGLVASTNSADEQATAVVVRQGGAYTPNLLVRQDVDREDRVERFLLLAPGAPLVIEAAMTIDGQSFRIPREKLIDEMLVAADKDKDGRPTWDEAVRSTRFSFGRFRAGNESQVESYRKQYDKNDDKLVDRAEARLFLATVSQGSDFVLEPHYNNNNYGVVAQANGRLVMTGGRVDILPLLDEDRDAVLSAEEIAAAAGRLKSRDANDDDLLYGQEVSGATQAAYFANQAANRSETGAAVLLGPTADAETLFKTLVYRYQFPKGELTAGSFPTLPVLFTQLDANADGRLAEAEVLGLNQIEPHLRLAVRLGNVEGEPAIVVERRADEVTQLEGPPAEDAANAPVKFERPGILFDFAAQAGTVKPFDYSQTAAQMLTQFDKDKNGYLEASELNANTQAYMQMWDDDGDGKIFAAEIVASYTRMMAPQMSQVRAAVADLGNSVFVTLDETGDGRLSLREMRTAAGRLKALDKNSDGQITPEEIPGQFSVTFRQGGQGGYGFSAVQTRGAGGQGQAGPSANRGPEWFAKMDRNGDGDVTLKEFLGDEEQFGKLDTNADGFVERVEAEAAKGADGSDETNGNDQAAKPVDADLLLRGGSLHRGDGQPAVVGDVAIAGGKIVAVGAFPLGQIRQDFNCRGLIVAPGFIDLHNHSDNQVTAKATRAVTNFLTQGCTTIVTGNCGSGPVDAAKYLAAIDEHGCGVNVAHLLPQGDLRREVVGTAERKATDDEIAKMKELADKAMRDGVWGMSSGLIYVPSCYADTAELIAIAKVVSKHGGLYVSHIRGEGTGLLASVEEAIEIGRQAECPVHISHFKSSGKDAWGLVRVATEMIEKQRKAGGKITADQYPYAASSTSLEATVVPTWARAGGQQAMLKRLDDAESGPKIREAIEKNLREADGGERLQIASFAKQPKWAGQRIAAIAQNEGVEPIELTLRILRDGGAAIVNHGMHEPDVQFVMTQPWVATASDGRAFIPGPDVPHPRSYGTFSRKIGRYAIREKTLPLEQAIRSASGLPADILGLKDRGYLRPGQAADIAVFDAEQFLDLATFDSPHRYSQGVRHVFVNGHPAVLDGHATGTLAGVALRREI